MRKFYTFIYFCITISFIVMFTNCATEKKEDKSKVVVQNTPEFTPFVNAFIGTDRGESEHSGARGNTHPGAVVPWGMVAVSPQTLDFTKTRLATGYRDGMDTIYGFSCVNFSGVGCPATGNFPFKFSSGDFVDDASGSAFSEQKAAPGHYSVKLDDEDIHVAASTTTRSVIFKLQLPKGKSNVYLDLTAQQGHVKGGEIVSHTNQRVSGYQLEGFFCGSDTMGKTFFNAEMDKKSDSVYLIYNNKTTDRFKQELDEKPSGVVYTYTNEAPTTLHIKLGASFVSAENAKDNLDKEQNGFNFNLVKENAHQQWEKELGKIKVTTSDIDEKTVFYTALYHSLLMPITYSDANGDYVLQDSDHKIGKANGYTRYTGFSLWDTYRTVHPLLALVYPERQLDMVKTMIGMYEEAGRLPKWELFGQEPNIMVGDPSAIVIADTYVKGIRDFDTDRAYEAMTHQADVVEGNMMRRGLKEYLELGYIAMDGPFSDVSNFQWKNGIVWGAVSTTMEFNLADYAIAQMAKGLKKEADSDRYLQRSMSFLKLYDPEYKLFRPKNVNGSWYTPFDPKKDRWEKMNFGLRGGPGYVEGSAWQYLFSIPHGIDNLKKVMGDDTFLKQLNALFNDGHFDMTNEPGLGFPFMYNYTDLKATKTAETVHQCLERYFPNVHNGLPGNDDAGTMSAWVVFAMTGMYPLTPSSPEYTFTTPFFEKIEIKLNADFYQGEQLTIRREGPKKGRIEQMAIDQKSFDYWLDHNAITSSSSEIVIKTATIEN